MWQATSCFNRHRYQGVRHYWHCPENPEQLKILYIVNNDYVHCPAVESELDRPELQCASAASPGSGPGQADTLLKLDIECTGSVLCMSPENFEKFQTVQVSRVSGCSLAQWVLKPTP